jgi:integrase
MPWKFKRAGSPYWQIGYMLDGVEQRVSSRTTSDKAADLIVSKLEIEIAEGRFLEKKRSSSWTLEQLGKAYLERMAIARPRSARWRGERWGVILAGLGKDTPIEDLDQAAIDRFAEGRLKAGKAVSTVKGEVHVVQHALRKGFDWGAETGLSALRIGRWTPPRDGPEAEPEPLSTAEAKRVLAVCRALAASRLREVREGSLLAWAFLGSGARPGEIYACRTRDLDLKRSVLRLPGFKRGRWRDVEIPRDLAAELARRASGPTLFPASGMRPQERYKEAWRRIKAAAKVDCRFYDLRHTYAAEYLRRGGDLRDLQYLMGHRSVTTTEKYARFSKHYAPPRGLDLDAPERVPSSVRSRAVKRGQARKRARGIS